jgi:hypothetical protein
MKHASPLAIAAAFAFSSLAPGVAHAAGSLKAAWVSGHGINTLGCGSLTNPCQTFQYTHDIVVAAGGLIAVLDSSNYGPLIIRNAISIVDDGGLAGIAIASGDAIDIQAGPTDAVFLKGLHIDGLGTASNGINLTSAGSLTVTNSTIKGFGAPAPGGNAGNGILIDPPSGAVNFTISDTLLSGNSYSGIYVFPSVNFGSGSTATIFGTLTRVEAVNNQLYGVAVSGGNTSGTVSVIANQVNASENVFSGFLQGVGNLYLSRSTATGNGWGHFGAGVVNNGGVYTYGDNSINGNATDVSGGAMTPAPLK